MPIMFVEGTYQFNNGTSTFQVSIESDKIWVSPDAPVALRMQDFFNLDNWTAVVADAT